MSFYDEGLIDYGAQRVAEGEVPYKDFWTMYGPGQFYALAAFFKLFGSSILTARLFSVLVRSCFLVLVFLLFKRCASRFFSVTCWLSLLLWLGAYGFYGYPVFGSLLFSMASLLFFLKWLSGYGSGSEGSLKWLAASGGVAGLTALFRHDVGFYLVLAESSTCLLYLFSRRQSEAVPAQAILLPAARSILAIVLGAVGVLLPVTIYLLCTVGTADLLFDLFVFPATIYPEMRSLPFPISDQTYFIPLIVFVLSLVLAVMLYVKKQRDTLFWIQIPLTLFGILLLNLARVRPDLIHIMPSVLLSLMVLFCLILFLVKRFLKQKIYVAVGAAIAVVLFLFPALKATLGTTSGSVFTWPERAAHKIEKAAFFNLWRPQAMAVEYIQSQVAEGESIFVGNSRHDTIGSNDALFYFLCERNCATRYHELHPGHATTLEVQEEIVSSLRKNSVAYAVVVAGFEGKESQNLSSVSSEVRLLDRYLKEHFHPVKRFGPYLILKRH